MCDCVLLNRHWRRNYPRWREVSVSKFLEIETLSLIPLQKSPQCSKYLGTFCRLPWDYCIKTYCPLKFWLFGNEITKLFLIETYCGQLFWDEVGKRTWETGEIQVRAIVSHQGQSYVATTADRWWYDSAFLKLILLRMHAWSNINLFCHLSFSPYQRNKFWSCLRNISILLKFKRCVFSSPKENTVL